MGGATSMLYSGAVEATAGTVVSGAFSSVTSTYEMQEGLDATLYSLQQEVFKIQCAINAARRRRIIDPKFFEWMASLIDAACLGNYYHRSFRNRNSFPLMIESEGTSNLAISTSCHAAKRRRTIKTLIFGDEKLRELHDTLKKLKSIDILAFINMVNAQPELPIRTYLYMDSNRLVHRDKEREQVMKFLFEPNMPGENNVNVLPIVGPYGVGKTSLALHCFYDPKVQDHFSLKIYIPLSRISCPPIHGSATTFVQILRKWYSTDITNFDMNTQLSMLKQNFSSEKILLLLDNVICVESMAWYALWDCLQCGKQGSKFILVSDLAVFDEYKKIGNPETVEPIMLDGFSEDEYMLFFREHAFGSTDPEDFPDLAKMGREIAKKMNGSIWGAKILGELLRDNLNAPFWSIFLRDGILSSENLNRKHIGSVVKTISKLLPRQLQKLMSLTEYLPDVQHRNHELTSYRELMLLGPNHCTPLSMERFKIKTAEILVTKHVFLNLCTVITANFGPVDD